MERRLPRALTFVVICIVSFFPSAASTSEISEIEEIQGTATLEIHSIGQSQLISATWEMTIQIPDSFGVDFLPEENMGIRHQVDSYLGDGDGIISSSESEIFSNALRQNRTWQDADEGGCCSFDHTPFQLNGSLDFISTPLEMGPVGGKSTWGWFEKANLTGLADQRQVRILELPRTGSIVEEIPLVVSLPGTWEYRFSAQSSVIIAADNGFTVDRSKVGAVSDIRISLGTNEPPVASAVREQGGSTTISASNDTTFRGVCSDNGLIDPLPTWHVSGALNLTQYHGEKMTLNTSVHDLKHGETIHVTMDCVDRHNSSSQWMQTVSIDTKPPILQPLLSISTGTGQWSDVTVENSEFYVPSGAVVRTLIEPMEENADPVSIQVKSNKSGGFERIGSDRLELTEAFFHGQSTNGPHREPGDRAIAREPSTYFLSIVASDSSGNTAEINWTIIVVDHEGPVIVPVVTHANQTLDMMTNLVTGSDIMVDLSQSYDRIDALNDTFWSVLFDDDAILFDTKYPHFNGIVDIRDLSPGKHVLYINAVDTNGHSSSIDIPLTVSFGDGVAFFENPITEVTGKNYVGENLIISVSAMNYGTGTGQARVCQEDICSPTAFIPAAGPDGPNSVVVYLALQAKETGKIDLTFYWSEFPSENESSIEINGVVTIENRLPEWLPPTLLSSLIVLISYIAIRRWGEHHSE